MNMYIDYVYSIYMYIPHADWPLALRSLVLSYVAVPPDTVCVCEREREGGGGQTEKEHSTPAPLTSHCTHT